ncbi:MAG: hypothetical protein SVM79_09040, partial [Chloroflexota bacterium]|nr:hypothetical protein [Chloroflexota bacterium]
MMRNSIFVGVLLLLLGLLLVPAPVSAEGNTYYVSPTGSNSNPGTEASPWRNILFAVNSASSGDTIKVMDNDILETVDYTENITILPGKDNLTITRYNNTGLNPQVKSGSGGSVFVIQSD